MLEHKIPSFGDIFQANGDDPTWTTGGSDIPKEVATLRMQSSKAVFSTGKPLSSRGLDAETRHPEISFQADPASSAFARAGRTMMSWLLKIGHALKNLVN